MLLSVPNKEPQARCITRLGPKRDDGTNRRPAHSHPIMRRSTTPARSRINVTGGGRGPESNALLWRISTALRFTVMPPSLQ
jgi:hypothetical protein